VQTFLYVVEYIVLTSLVLLPMTVYEGFFRERTYGLMNQSFGSWFKDQVVALGVGLLFGGVSAMVLYGVVRRLPRTWATWGAVATILLSILGILLAPVYVFPLFNKYTRLSDEVVRPAILDLALSEGVPAKDVFVFDASRQTKRVSANVSGFASTMRISLNDNLLNRSSLAEIEAVMGHEIGHYVLHHIYKTIIFVSIVIAVGFAFLKWASGRLLARRANTWGVRDIGDTAGLPLVSILLSAYFFVLTPVLNSYTRVEEAEADLFGINASGQPDGEALADLKLGEYRKLDPTPLEELVFFDHPAGRNRILMAMRWKAEHLAESEANARRAREQDAARGWSEETARTWAKAHEPR
jgi:STE24 endopeptidase